MRSILSRLVPILLAVSLPALTGCGKVKTVAAKLSDLKRGAAAAAAKTDPGAAVSEIDKAAYPAFVAKKDALVIVDFHAGWCPPCKLMGPALEKAVAKHPGVAFLGKVDVDRAKDLAGESGVRSIPDVRIFKNGAEVDRMIGFPGEAEVLARIDRLAAGMKSDAGAGVSAATAAAPPEPKIRPAEKGWLPPGITRKGAAPHSEITTAANR